MSTMTPEDARRLVIADQRAALLTDETDDQIIAHVRNTLRLPEDEHVPGSYPIEEDGSQTAEAYRLILSEDRTRGEDGWGLKISPATDGEHVRVTVSSPWADYLGAAPTVAEFVRIAAPIVDAYRETEAGR
jgi:hypothetical protein